MSPRITPPALQLVESETMADKVYQQLREALMSGRFAPGQALSLRGVAEAVGSSTMPVRAALTRLAAERALVDGPNRALVVPPMTLEMLDELRDVRIALEGCVAARATARMDEAQVGEVRALCETMHTHAEAGDTREYLRANFAFHRAIYRHGASESTLAIIENLWMRIGPFLNMVAPDIPHMRRSMVAHRAIVEAIARGDGAGAKAGIALDIDGAAHDLATTLGTARDAEDGAEHANKEAAARLKPARA
ncbi:GntR family transcriptional regulator [Burkholderia gladioli]|uniref:Bacterial regulatory s, gntR family protein n=1 Tax=Burkholderia gladioli TaxID=28095 RepID=A0AAW3EYD7_BURGA|nr:GntR family transcriptional regulator [Burkholderia gladioli]AJW94221.1 bacterial regulatory s, gntR family protein [Burkholderia gladioli]ASD82189.1 GntR family transcriptional regulator [Burkholderia gladioli pv. gladioli]AWY52439.1 GntR family transcriptional regulator [Burkholderia gladioli pv. gladioli]KGC13058.1 bacterial regulatory s, gntR family protein [Burkholderia gladioli]MBU9173522.1 GntR family transcriptional regulator [Burkholderia gladioli]